MKKTLKKTGVILILILVIAAITIYLFASLLVSLINGDEVFDTTPEEVESFKQVHLDTPSAIDLYFDQLNPAGEAEFEIMSRQIVEDQSFKKSTYTKDEGSFDRERQVYVDVTYRVESSRTDACDTCLYNATATYEYQDGYYELADVSFNQDWLQDTLNQNTAPEYVEAESLPDSPYYYNIVSDNGLTISFNELSATGYWDKDPENYMLTASPRIGVAPLQEGVIVGDLFAYAVDDENKPVRQTGGFIRINADKSVSLYELPSRVPGEQVDISDATLLKTFHPK